MTNATVKALLSVVVGVIAVACAETARDRGSLAFHGWHVGLPVDSARLLTRAEMADTLSCYPDPPLKGPALFCSAGKTNSPPGVSVLVWFSDQHRVDHLEYVRALPNDITTDSLRAWLVTAWGPPDSTNIDIVRKPLQVEAKDVTWLGNWNRGTSYAYAYEARHRTAGRWLMVGLADREKLIRSEEASGLRPPRVDRFKP